MTTSARGSDPSAVQARVIELLTDIFLFVDTASEQQQRRILTALEDLRERERREHPRKACSMRVTVTTPDLFSTDTIRDISAGGAFVETPVALSAGDQITLWFSLPERREPIMITGEVVWSPRKGVGVKFVSCLDKALIKMIEAL
jgi:Tfp pilus assembly protein PilZ